jgi:hypothetical protein
MHPSPIAETSRLVPSVRFTMGSSPSFMRCPETSLSIVERDSGLVIRRSVFYE